MASIPFADKSVNPIGKIWSDAAETKAGWLDERHAPDAGQVHPAAIITKACQYTHTNCWVMMCSTCVVTWGRGSSAFESAWPWRSMPWTYYNVVATKWIIPRRYSFGGNQRPTHRSSPNLEKHFCNPHPQNTDHCKLFSQDSRVGWYCRSCRKHLSLFPAHTQK